MSATPEPRIRASGDVEWGIPAEPLPTETSHDFEAPVQASAPDYGRLSLEDLGEILRLAAKGKSQREIAALVGCSQPSVGYALKRMADGPDSIRALAKAKATKALAQWETAIDKAADRGDHRPAREFIELAHSELRPQPANTGQSGGVTVIVAVPNGQHNPLPAIQVTAVNTHAPETRSETMVLSQIAVSEGRGLEPQLSQTEAKGDFRPSLSLSTQGESAAVTR